MELRDTQDQIRTPTKLFTAAKPQLPNIDAISWRRNLKISITCYIQLKGKTVINAYRICGVDNNSHRYLATQ